MKFQYEPPRLTLGVVGAIAIIIPILLGYFLITGFANNPAYTNLGAPATTTTTQVATSTALSGVVDVSIPNGAGAPTGAPGYAPDNITITAGTTVVWTNNDPTAHHTVTSVTGNGTVSSGDMATGATYNFTFTAPGTYNIICVYHPWMKQTIKVVPATTTPAVVKVSMPAGAGAGPQGAPGYSPDIVKVPVGTTVVWSNNDTVAHTVTSATGNGSLNSGNMNPGAVYNFTFTTPGTYDYVCAYHPWMTGTVVVTPAASSPPSGPATSSSTTTSTTTTTASSSSATTSFSGAYTVNVVSSPTLGSYLVNATGFTLYYFAPDHQGNATSPPVSTCGTALDCLQVWPIFYAAKITVPAGLNASDFTTFTRSDGSLQTAYKGWPLYYYVGDKSAGETKGQDTLGSGGYWYVASVSGNLTGLLGSTTTTSAAPLPEPAVPVPTLGNAGYAKATAAGHNGSDMSLVARADKTVVV